VREGKVHEKQTLLTFVFLSFSEASAALDSGIPNQFHGIWNAPGKCAEEAQGVIDNNITIDRNAIIPIYYMGYYIDRVLEKNGQFTATYEMRSEEGMSGIVTFSMEHLANDNIKLSGKVDLPKILVKCE
jgi:hypothetical protein